VTAAPGRWPALAAITALAAWVRPWAIVNKQLASHDHATFATPADMAGALFDGSSKVTTALQVVAALVLLGATAATLAGVWQTMRGERGGVELAASGVFGVVGLMAALTVVM
jgi:cobalamin biosynthesis Mg chelatase CobN